MTILNLNNFVFISYKNCMYGKTIGGQCECTFLINDNVYHILSRLMKYIPDHKIIYKNIRSKVYRWSLSLNLVYNRG